MKKSKKILIAIISLILICGLLLWFLLCKKETKKELRLEDDFYAYVNAKDLEKEISSTDGEISYFQDVQDRIDDISDEITRDLLENGTNQNMKNLYSNFLNEEKRNEQGITPLIPYLDLIDSSNSMSELVNNITTIENELGVSILLSYEITLDFNDNSKLIVAFGGNQFCQLNKIPQYKSMLNLRYENVSDTFKLYGYTDEQTNAFIEQQKEYDTKVCENTLTLEETNDIEKNYTKITLQEFYNIYSNIDLKNYLSILGLSDDAEIYVADINYHKNRNGFLTEQNLDYYKKLFKMSLLSTFGSSLSMDYYNLTKEFMTKINGFYPYETYEEEAFKQIQNIYTDLIDQEFAKRYFSEEKRNELTQIISEIVKYYENVLQNNSWLSEKTKEKAIEKVKNLKIVIGEPEKYSGVVDNLIFDAYENGGSLFKNQTDYFKALRDKELDEFKNNNTYIDEWGISVRTFNAYYLAQNNSINIPASVAFVLDDNDNNYYANLGSIGMIIAHEITHAFDSTGAKFDLYGNMTDWWLDEDYNNFKIIQDKIITYYNKYKSSGGYAVNGELTLGENIADLGAMQCVTSIAESHDATNEDYKKMYEAYAHLWYSKMLPLLEVQQVSVDTHSPNNVRVNAVLSSTDKFYEVYGITKDDDMYVSEESRVKCW